jgi:hypothetical protein
MAGRLKLSVSLTQRDFGYKKIIEEVHKLAKKPYIKIGIQSESGMHKAEGGGAKTVAYIASVHEYGAPDQGIPPRSFINSTMDEKRSTYVDQANMLHDQILTGGSDMTTEKALGLLGESIQRDIQNKVRSNIAPALKPSTIRSKNRSVLTKAQSKINALEKKLNKRAFADALKNGGRGKGKLTQAERAQENTASDLLTSGGSSIALIDSSQMVRSIRYKKVMNGNE